MQVNKVELETQQRSILIIGNQCSIQEKETQHNISLKILYRGPFIFLQNEGEVVVGTTNGNSWEELVIYVFIDYED